MISVLFRDTAGLPLGLIYDLFLKHSRCTISKDVGSSVIVQTGHPPTNCSISCREVLLGITGKDFVIIAASKAAVRGPTILKATDDKTRQLNNHTLMAYSGEPGDGGENLKICHLLRIFFANDV